MEANKVDHNKLYDMLAQQAVKIERGTADLRDASELSNTVGKIIALEKTALEISVMMARGVPHKSKLVPDMVTVKKIGDKKKLKERA